MDNWFKQKITSPVVNYFGRKKESRHFSKPPIIIVGCGRSGTSLLLSILSAHPSIYAIARETDAFTNWIRENGNLKPARLDRFYRHLLFKHIGKGKKRWCEKRPMNIHYISELIEYFPGVKIVHIVRDPRAVTTSYHPTKPNQYWILAERYIEDLSAIIPFLDHPQIYTIRYEDLINSYISEIQKLLNFLEEPFCFEMENWETYASVRKNKAWFTSIRSIDRAMIDKWKHPRHHNHIVELINNSEVIKVAKIFGYELE